MVPKPAVVELAKRVDPDNAGSYARERQAVIIERLARTGAVTSDLVQEEFDRYRYPERPAMYLYLLGDPSQISLSAASEAVRNVGIEPRHALSAAPASTDGISDEQFIFYEEEETFDGIREWRFRYFRRKAFLNQDEDWDTRLEAGYGFVWVDDVEHALIVICNDERVVRSLVRRVSAATSIQPMQVTLSKGVIARHFRSDDRRRYSLNDQATGERMTTARKSASQVGPMWQESQRFDSEYERPTDFYEERLPDGTIVGLGMTSSKGRLYVTRPVTTSVFREWAPERLRGILRDTRGEFDEVEAIAAQIDVDALGLRLRRNADKNTAASVLAGVVASLRSGMTRLSFPLPSSTEQVSRALSGYLQTTGEVYCDECLGPALVGTPLLPGQEQDVEDVFGHTIHICADDPGLVFQPTARFVAAARDAAASLLKTGARDDFTFYLAGGAVHVLSAPKADDFLCDFDAVDVLAAAATPAGDLTGTTLAELSDRIRGYGEKCSKTINPLLRSTTPTAQNCISCLTGQHAGRTYGCLMKLFSPVPGCTPSPHGVNESGDVSFTCRVNGTQWPFKGLLKGYPKSRKSASSDGFHPCRSVIRREL